MNKQFEDWKSVRNGTKFKLRYPYMHYSVATCMSLGSWKTMLKMLKSIDWSIVEGFSVDVNFKENVTMPVEDEATEQSCSAANQEPRR